MTNNVCGKPTQTFSRISGYYRPIQNWNYGKAQEFKDRKEYDQRQAVEGEALGSVKKDTATPETPIHTADEGTMDIDLEGFVLFSTKTCPNCKAAKDFMDKLGVKYTVIMADENMDLIKALDLHAAPTLVNFKNGVAREKIASYPEIRKYIASLPADEVKECDTCKF